MILYGLVGFSGSFLLSSYGVVWTSFSFEDLSV
jgi:hypothetical protein